ncbi:unnamed protein product, partial [Scytosiphon promiscuus]
MASMDVEKLFILNQDREQALRTLLKTRPSESRDVQALRAEMRGAYSEILGMDPEFCASKDVELLLWKNCYYKRIEDFRKRLRKYAHLASSLERAKAFEAREHLHGICQAFGRFLSEATEFYSSLLRRFEAMQHQYAKGGELSASAVSGGVRGPMGAGNSSDQRRARLLRLVVQSINRCFIFLGDLARYRELHGENSVKDWTTAERYYHQALAVLPTSGNPHNQLAVLATYTDAECVSVYCYCRSLMIESPFQTAHENLTLLFEKNKQKGFAMPTIADGKDGLGGGRDSMGGGGPHHHSSKGKGKGSGGRGNTGALLKSFLRRFVRLHGMVFSGKAEDLEDFPSIFETAIADFRTLLSNSAFGDALLLKMVVICIFSVTHVAEQTESPSAAGAAAGSSSANNSEEAPLLAAAPPRRWRWRDARAAAPAGPGGGVRRGQQEPAVEQPAAAAAAGVPLAGARADEPVALFHNVYLDPTPCSFQQSETARPSHPWEGKEPFFPCGVRRRNAVAGTYVPSTPPRHHAYLGAGARGSRSPDRPTQQLQEAKAEMRAQFWEVVQRLSATLPDPDPMNQADAFPGDPLGRRRPLKEHVELRGNKVPLCHLYKKRYAMDGPAVPAVPDDCAGSVRIRGLKAFATAVSGEPLAPLSAPGDVVQYSDGHGGLLMMAAGGGGAGSTSSHHRENRSEYSESSSGSHSHHLHDSGRPFELALRPSGPSSQHSSHRAPPGMGGGHGGERPGRAFSGSGPIGTGGGYFGSGSSLGAASEGDTWRASKGSGPGG